MKREAGNQGKVTQTYCCVQNNVCVTYACRADVRASGLQKLELIQIVD